MKQKGQYLSLEQMTLFAISIIVTVLLYISFSTLEESAGETIMENQLDEVNEVVLSGIYRAYSSYKNGEGYKMINAEIPERISEETYTIEVREGKRRQLMVYVDETEDQKHSARFIGKVADDVDIRMDDDFVLGMSSAKGRVEIKLIDDEIIIGR